MFCTYIFYFEIRAFLELFTIYGNIQREHKNWKKIYAGIGDLTVGSSGFCYLVKTVWYKTVQFYEGRNLKG